MRSRQSVARLMAISTLLSGAGALGMTTVAGATTAVTVTRLQGANRFGTAAAVAEAAFPSGVTGDPAGPVAVLASGVNFPDALSGAYLAGKVDAPILLTNTDTLPPETGAALTKLGVQQVDVVGGPAAVSDAVVSTLETTYGLMVRRIYGANRDVTAEDVAELYPGTSVGTLGGKATAILATDLEFPDALTGSAMSYGASLPTLLTPASTLGRAAADALTQLGTQQVLVLGGTSAISPSVVASLTSMHISVKRLAGPDRTATATAIADFELADLGFSDTSASLARGDMFPDALAGGAYAGHEREPIVLSDNSNVLGIYTTSWLRAHSSTLSHITVLGGTAALSNATVAAAQQAAS